MYHNDYDTPEDIVENNFFLNILFISIIHLFILIQMYVINFRLYFKALLHLCAFVYVSLGNIMGCIGICILYTVYTNVLVYYTQNTMI